jgi:DNA end-binding protein Ku
MAATVWKGYITFGLISIPIRLFVAARPEHLAFHQLHEVCHTRVKQQLWCPHCERVVERNEIVRGYEVNKGNWVVVSDEEIKRIEPHSTSTMEISQFVKVSEVDPIYFDASYYAVPEEPGRKAYRLLVETMKKSGYAAVAKVGMHEREYVVVMRPYENGLTLHTIYYPNEVRAVPEYEKQPEGKVSAQEVKIAEQIIQSMAGAFEPKRYEDEYQKRVWELVESKSEGKSLPEATPARRKAPVIDLMQALKKSLANVEKKPAAHAAWTVKKARAHG